MNQPDLTRNIEKKLITLIQATEQKSRETNDKVDSKLYLQLADLYHFHKNYKAEVAVLKRFSQLKNAVETDLGDIFERIERITGLLQHTVETKLKSQPLTLVDNAAIDEKISIHSDKQVIPRVDKDKKPFDEAELKILTLSAAYTGTTDSDEIIQVAMVLTEHASKRMKKSKLLSSYWGVRNTRAAIPKKVVNQFNLNLKENEVSPFSREAARVLISQADMIVSHNDAEVERKLLATLIPEIADIPWYSSERDIPWRAMGFDSNRLTQLAGQLDERAPHTCMDRAQMISRILQKLEPYSTQTYLERIYNMRPMAPFQWTEALQKQSARLNKSETGKKFWLLLSIIAMSLLAAVGYWYLSWLK